MDLSRFNLLWLMKTYMRDRDALFFFFFGLLTRKTRPGGLQATGQGLARN